MTKMIAALATDNWTRPTKLHFH